MSRIIMASFIYLDDYSDEVCPCQPTLQGWAEWLSKPALDWGRRKSAKDGDTFTAGTIELYDDIIATKGDDGKWAFSGSPPDDADHFAVRHGLASGWDVDSICGTFGDLIDYLAEYADDTDGEEHVVVGRWVEGLVVTYHHEAGGTPRCTWALKQ
ncbi:hypothetical protein [Sphingobium sp. YG1]|uniref:hypothetical protein n=1 Tax=Sphingobium sp. YG1 TaxID=2082188 RepID=UPI000DBB2753|nr:hypothetical protein [Sphingobium sp. YG1]BBD01864.1 hypothetical protein YGS_C1P3119 [Sphingobium sp. YG1]